MPSRDWEYFMDNFFGNPYMMWHDGINPAAAKYLKGEEREKGIDMLIESMDEGSYWAPMGLREMNAERAIPALKERLPNSYNRQTIEIAHALNVLESTNEYVPIIIRTLREAPFWSSRMDAAILLRQYNLPDVVEALYDSMLDPDYLVRNHSSESLLHIHGLEASISQHKEIFAEMIVEFDSKNRASSAEARKHYARSVELLKELIAAEGK
ncbi:MAG: HEAT repeat domain-containing protein [Candidatus Thorarchaeota archaeon]